MNHKGTQLLKTEHLTLRRFTEDDAEPMFRNWASDSEVTKFLTWPAHPCTDVSRAVLGDWLKSYSDNKYYQWAIVPDDNNNEPVGSIAAVRVDDECELVHIGYCIGKRWWHRGIMSEALGALIRFFFEEVGANRVEARHDPRNPNSGKVMQKCGMTYEGTLRSADHNNQGICDCCYYGILRSEYTDKK